MIKYKTNNHL